MTYTRLPKQHFTLLCGNAKPSVFGLRYVAYDGGIWLELVDRFRLHQTLHALQETVESGNIPQMKLYNLLEHLWVDSR